jgi:hypothetical protein
VGTRRGDAPGTRAGRDRGRGRGDAPARRRVCRLSGLSRGSPCPAFLEEGEREERRPQRLRVAPELPVLDQRPPDEPSEAGRVLRVGGSRHARTKGQAGGTARGDESLGVASPPLPRRNTIWYRTTVIRRTVSSQLDFDTKRESQFLRVHHDARAPALALFAARGRASSNTDVIMGGESTR